MAFEAAKKFVESIRSANEGGKNDPIADMDARAKVGLASAENAEKLAILMDSDEDLAAADTRGSGVSKIEEVATVPTSLAEYKKMISDQPAEIVNIAFQMVTSTDRKVRKEGLQILEGEIVNNPSLEGKFELAYRIAQSEYRDVNKVGDAYLNGIALAKGASRDLRLEVVGAMYKLGGEDAKIFIFTQLSEHENVSPMEQAFFASRLASADFPAAKKAFEKIMTNPDTPPMQKLNIGEFMGKCETPEVRDMAAGYLELMACSPSKSVYVEYRIRAVEITKEIWGASEGENLLRKITQSSKIPLGDRLWAAKEISAPLDGFKGIISDPSISMGDRINIIESDIALEHPVEARTMLEELRKARINKIDKVRVMVSLAKLSPEATPGVIKELTFMVENNVDKNPFMLRMVSAAAADILEGGNQAENLRKMLADPRNKINEKEKEIVIARIEKFFQGAPTTPLAPYKHDVKNDKVYYTSRVGKTFNNV